MAVDGVKIESDEDGWRLTLLVDDYDDLVARRDDGGYRLVLPLPQDAAIELAEAVKPIQEWWAEGEAVRADFEQYKRTGEKPDYLPRDETDDTRERLAVGADLQRKAEKESR